MTYQLTVSPDFPPSHLAGWHIFNTWLQRKLDTAIHLELYDSFESQRDAIMQDQVDIIYANPYDAAMLVRENGFVPVARPENKPDEVTIVVNAEHSAQSVDELEPGISIASTDDPDVHMMGMIILESADLDRNNTERTICDSYILVAKALLNNTCNVGFFLADAFNELSGLVRKQLRPLVTSQIQIIHHSLLLGPRLADRQQELRQILLAMQDNPKDAGILESLLLSSWEAVDQEEMEFMIDLMSTLND